jgi:hypothetical protein
MEPSVKVKAGRTTQEQWLITYVGIFVTMASVYAWDDAGHLLTAQIAYDRLSPAAQQSLQAQLSGLGEGAHTYNAISAACYMDDLRRDKNVDGSWHYIAPPFTSSGLPLPTNHNVVWALNYTVSVYKGLTTDSHITRQQALAMVMHLTGDIHQPLHCTTHTGLNGKDDGNGNGIAVTNMPDAQYPNLHSYWDSAFQRTMTAGVVKKSYTVARPISLNDTKLEARAAELIAAYPPSTHWKTGGFDPQRWAKESHRLGYRYAYKSLPGGENITSLALTDPYVATAHDLACQRIVLAGYRLAALLTDLLPPPPPATNHHSHA